MASTVTRKGQVTVPKRVRDLLGITPGSAVEFRLEGDRVIFTKVGEDAHHGRFAKLRGHAGAGLSTDAIMALTRGER
ncbi:AbrB/MazE/SpoVT family DNA-binding domain-containing protein [Xanthobacter autotrophicus]|uniref:AbrB/MazE/SpoVT family DNA-binding domain-containing protein n=1 Tax=Xanthobacter TaxID=279 RepID=UPI0024ABA794|nr:AbrB/MazE/SpoVT family DNA-binding domain-containing protein [Xanthobacter autotrophicus]MDI4662801.1 AbrB/MazE/SpoVT family DNA-binding domain-containing protein [Xanthobacter autotrophicus]